MVNRAVPVFAPIQVGPVQDSGHHEAKVGSKRVDGHGASSVSGLKPYQAAEVFQWSVFYTEIIQYILFILDATHAKNWQQDKLIDGEEGDFKHGHDQQLDWAGFTQDGSEGDKHRTGAKVGIDHTERQGF